MDRSPSAIRTDLSVAVEPAGDEGPQWVFAEAEAELAVRYGDISAAENDLIPAMFDPPEGAFVVARRGDAAGPPLGGVGVRTIRPGVGQIRRLWVDPACRGTGVARALMAGVEDAARALGLTDLRLSTGDRQPEAVALYASTGWERILVDGKGRPVPERHNRFTKRLMPS